MSPRLLIACILLLHAPPASAAAPPNLLLNPGFESLRGDLTAHWDTTDAGLPTVFFGRDSVEKRSGSASVYIANLSTAVPMWHNWSQTLLVGPETWGKDVLLTVWTRSNGLQGRAYVLLQCYKDTLTHVARTLDIPREEAAMRLGVFKISDPELALDWQRLYFSDENTDWVRREVRAYVAPRTNVLFVRLGIFGTGQVFFDDAELTLVRARPPAAIPPRVNLLADAGFEGDGNLWEYSLPPYTGLRVERDTTLAHSGRASMRYSEGKRGIVHARTGVCQAVTSRALGRKRFKIGGWCRTDSLQGTAFLAAYAHTPDTTHVLSVAGRLGGTNDWTYGEDDFETPPGTLQLWVWAVYSVPARGTVWFDDISLEYLGPAAPKPARRPAKPPPSRKPAAPSPR